MVSDADHDVAFLEDEDELLRQLPPWSPDHSASYDEVFSTPDQSQSHDSLDWDNLSMPIQVGQRGHSTTIEQSPPETRPANSPEISPVSPYVYPGRITRSLVRSGQFDLEPDPLQHPVRTERPVVNSQTSSEAALSPFHRDNLVRRPITPARSRRPRNNPALRRPRVTVMVEDDSTIRISDGQWARLAEQTAAAAGRRRARPVPLTAPTSPETSE